MVCFMCLLLLIQANTILFFSIAKGNFTVSVGKQDYVYCFEALCAHKGAMNISKAEWMVICGTSKHIQNMKKEIDEGIAYGAPLVRQENKKAALEKKKEEKKQRGKKN